MRQSPEILLTPRPPFDFAKTLWFLHGFRSSPDSRSLAPGRLRQALWVDGHPLLVTLVDEGEIARPALRLSVAGETLDDALVAAAAARVRAWLGLDDDLERLGRVGGRDPAFAPLLERLYGLHLVRYPSLFEGACWALIQQRTPNGFAERTMERLRDALGVVVEGDGERYRLFPEPARLARGARPELLEATNNTRKTDRLEPLAAAFTTVDEDALRDAPWDAAVRRLKRLPGLGTWSADYLMLRALGRTERLPWSDTALIESVSAAYTGGFTISPGDVRELAEGYGASQGLWLHYLKLGRYRLDDERGPTPADFTRDERS